jgi:hypothetical protein
MAHRRTRNFLMALLLISALVGLFYLISTVILSTQDPTPTTLLSTSQSQARKPPLWGGGGGQTSKNAGGGGKPSQPTSLAVTVVDCHTLVIGAGVGGLTMGYRLASILHENLCIVDERGHVGGKVFSYHYTASTAQRPVWTPTHAEQMRGGDSILRCIGQELGMVSVKRGSVNAYLEAWVRGYNTTGFQCYGNVTPSAPAGCPFGLPYEGVAPNGWLAPNAYSGLINPCANKDWTQCSYEDEYYTKLLSNSNANTISDFETFEDYGQRILGLEGFAYLMDVGIATYLAKEGARYVVEYLKYDFGYPYGALPTPHGGPQQGVLVRMAKQIANNGSQIFLNEKVKNVTLASGADLTAGRYVAMTETTKFRAKRVVFAMPAGQVAQLGGAIPTQLSQSKFIQKVGAVHACTWNAFFPSKWWQPRVGRCIFGFCAVGSRNFTLSPHARNHTTWSYWENPRTATSFDFIQYIGTPERQEGNLLRFFFDNEGCEPLDVIFEADGLPGVVAELMARVHAKFDAVTPGGVVPEPVESWYASDRNGYHYIKAGADFGSAALLQWARQPLPNEKICLVSESFNVLDQGWMEGAAKSAHSCLGGNVFSDLIKSTTLQSLERCRATITSGSNRYLDDNNMNSGNDLCLLMRNEYHLRDLANFTYCGGPKIYVYPTLQSFQDQAYTASLSLWSAATTEAVYETSPIKTGRGYKVIR